MADDANVAETTEAEAATDASAQEAETVTNEESGETTPAETVERSTPEQAQSNYVPSYGEDDTVATKAVETLRFDRIRRLRELVNTLGPVSDRLLDLLKGIDLGELSAILRVVAEFFAIEEGWDTETGAKARVRKILEVLGAFTRVTPGDVDNQILDAVDQVLGNEAVLDVVAKLISRMAGSVAVSTIDVDVLSNHAQGDELERVKQSGISFGNIVSLIKLIMELISAFRGAE